MANYYSSGTQCYSCPSQSGYSGLAPAGTPPISSCYQSRTAGTDDMGSFSYLTTCYYTTP